MRYFKEHEGRWMPIKVLKYGPTISDLFCAKDVIFFAKARSCQAKEIATILDSFCAMSGLKVAQ